MKKFKKWRSNLAFNIIGFIVVLMVLFGLIVGVVGYAGFTEAFQKEYAESTYHMADTATTLINGDHLDLYLSNGEDAEYLRTKNYLDNYCQKMHVSLIYVIKVDTTDYGRFVSVFNSVENTVDNTNYTPWELGHQRDTTNEEYRQKYKALYNKKAPYETVYRTTDLHGHHPHITTLVPVTDSAGKVVSLLCIQRPMSELNNARMPFLFEILVCMVILSVFAALFAASYLKRQFVQPIQKVSEEAIRFATENTEGEKLGAVSKIDEIANLAKSIDTMETDMLRYVDNLTAVTAEKEHISAELSVARTIQANSVPNIFPAFPSRTDFDIFASMTTAKEVGGDFYNFFLVDNDHLAIVIGDVSGKGIPAALFMMVTNILISDRTKLGGSPAEILGYVNDNLCEHNQAEMFVTLWLGILELSTGKLTAANAGHDDALLYRKGGAFEPLKTKHGLLAGSFPGIRYKDFAVQLNGGDKLFLYTDGVTEATDRENRLYSSGRLLCTLNTCRDESPQQILCSVHQSVSDFVDGAPQFDDLTMLCIEMKHHPHRKILTIDATVDNLNTVTAFINEILEAADCPPKKLFQIDLAVEEIFVNIAHYAYGDGKGRAEVQAEIEDNTFTVTFKDSGKPFDPLKHSDPDTTLGSEERGIGGLGILLVKKNMDEVSYDYADGKNIFTMRKIIR